MSVLVVGHEKRRRTPDFWKRRPENCDLNAAGTVGAILSIRDRRHVPESIGFGHFLSM
jgi:hypothetical protein